MHIKFFEPLVSRLHIIFALFRQTNDLRQSLLKVGLE